MKLRAWITAACTVLIVASLAGCQSKGADYKQAALDALAKNKEITDYSFQGKADFRLPSATPSSDTNLAASALLNALKTSAYSWNGTASEHPVRMEATLTLTPSGGTEGLQIPIMLKDNKMYFRIPQINQDGEYYRIDANQMAQISGGQPPLSFETLSGARDAVGQTLNRLFTAIDDKYFHEDKQDDGSVTVYVDITQDNAKAIGLALYRQWPSIVDDWSKDNLITSAQAEKLKALFAGKTEADAAAITVTQPGRVALGIDSQGFVNKQSVSLDLNVKRGGQDTPMSIHVENSLSQINQHPAFQQQEPTKVRDFTEILKLLNPSPAAAK